jgi:hypothetical protein
MVRSAVRASRTMRPPRGPHPSRRGEAAPQDEGQPGLIAFRPHETVALFYNSPHLWHTRVAKEASGGRQVKTTPFHVGIAIFATIVAMTCNGLAVEVPATLQQAVMLSAPPVSIGVLIGLISCLYFARFVRSGSFPRFSLEYWLASSACYLVMMSAVIGLSLARRDKLSVPADWASEFAVSILPKSLTLIDIGIGIFVFSLFANQYLKTSK